MTNKPIQSVETWMAKLAELYNDDLKWEFITPSAGQWVLSKLQEFIADTIEAEKKALLEHIRDEIEKMPVYLTDERFSPSEPPEYIHTINLDDALTILTSAITGKKE